MNWDEAFAVGYEEWSAHMTEDVAFYVGLAREAAGPVVELAVGNGRVAIPVARATGQRVIGFDSTPAMLEQARVRASDAGVELDLRAKELRDRRVEVYPRFLDAARKVSTVAQAVYEQCPYDFTPSGCDGDRKDMDQALREYFRTRGDIMVWGSKRANNKADAVTNILPNADLLPCLRLKPTSVGLTARMCLPSATGDSFIWVERRPSGELVNENGEVVVAKQQPRVAEFEAAVREFQVVMSCDVSPQPANSC